MIRTKTRSSIDVTLYAPKQPNGMAGGQARLLVPDSPAARRVIENEGCSVRATSKHDGFGGWDDGLKAEIRFSSKKKYEEALKAFNFLLGRS